MFSHLFLLLWLYLSGSKLFSTRFAMLISHFIPPKQPYLESWIKANRRRGESYQEGRWLQADKDTSWRQKKKKPQMFVPICGLPGAITNKRCNSGFKNVIRTAPRLQRLMDEWHKERRNVFFLHLFIHVLRVWLQSLKVSHLFWSTFNVICDLIWTNNRCC